MQHGGRVTGYIYMALVLDVKRAELKTWQPDSCQPCVLPTNSRDNGATAPDSPACCATSGFCTPCIKATMTRPQLALHPAHWEVSLGVTP